MNPLTQKVDRLHELAEQIKAGVPLAALSSGEQILAAFISNRMEWLPDDYRDALEALDRVGADWISALIMYRRNVR